jgi:hypothetical protein
MAARAHTARKTHGHFVAVAMWVGKLEPSIMTSRHHGPADDSVGVESRGHVMCQARIEGQAKGRPAVRVTGPLAPFAASEKGDRVLQARLVPKKKHVPIAGRRRQK